MPPLNNQGLRIVSGASIPVGYSERRPDGASGDRAPAVRAVLESVGLDFVMKPGPAYIADAKGVICWGNAAWQEFAFTRLLAMGRETDMMPWPVEELRAALAEAGPLTRTDDFPNLLSSEILESQHWAAWDHDGSIIGFAGVIVSGTGEERLRRQHAALQERYDDLTRLVSEGIWETDASLRLISLTPRISELAGFHPREMIGKTLQDFGYFVNSAGAIADNPLSADRPQPFRDCAFILRDASGANRHFRMAGLPVFDDAGRFKGFRGTARDVTGEALALGLVAQSRSQLTQAIESISDGFALYDSTERLLLWNQRYLSALPKTASSIHVGMRFQEIMRAAYSRGDIKVANGEEQLRSLDLTSRARKHIAVEYELSDGRWIRATDRLTSDGSIVGIRTDITETKLRELALIQAKEAAERANRSKSEFLGNVSHELRTPLNAIIGFSELILSEVMGPVGNEQYKSYLGDVLSSGRHLLDVINDILDLARVESGRLELNLEVIDINDVVESVLRSLSERALRAQLRLVSKIDVNLPNVEADPRKLRQILFNLVGNAIKFTPAGGAVTVTVARGDQGDLVLRVIDSGIGMSPNDIEVAFRPFGQVDGSLSRRFVGTGLGLPLTRAIVELHGGSLDIESAIGSGTSVVVRLPPSQTRFLV